MPRVIRYIDGRTEIEDRPIVRELPLKVVVNNQEVVTLVCTPDDRLHSMLVGFLWLEGFIEHLNEIVRCEVSGSVARIEVAVNLPKQEPRGIGASPTDPSDGFASNPAPALRAGGLAGLSWETVSQLPPMVDVEPSSVRGVRLSCFQVTDLMLQTSRTSESYREHGGIHTSALAQVEPSSVRGDTILCLVEDLGKHNTFDKIAGECLKQGLSPEGKVLLSSGRITSKMLFKAAKMRVPIVISRTSPTSLAVELAEPLGVTLVGYARGNSCRVYTNAHRIFSPSGATPVRQTGVR